MVCSIGVWLKVCFHLSQGISCAESIQFHLQVSLSVEGPEGGRRQNNSSPESLRLHLDPHLRNKELWLQMCQKDKKQLFWAALDLLASAESLVSAGAHITQPPLIFILTSHKYELLAEGSNKLCSQTAHYFCDLNEVLSRHGEANSYSTSVCFLGNAW